MEKNSANPEPERGFYKVAENWKSDDDGEDYFPGFMNKTGWPLIKTVLLIAIFFALRSLMELGIWSSIFICLLVIALY